jgi:hypothetical protein
VGMTASLNQDGCIAPGGGTLREKIDFALIATRGVRDIELGRRGCGQASQETIPKRQVEMGDLTPCCNDQVSHGGELAPGHTWLV